MKRTFGLIMMTIQMMILMLRKTKTLSPMNMNFYRGGIFWAPISEFMGIDSKWVLSRGCIKEVRGEGSKVDT